MKKPLKFDERELLEVHNILAVINPVINPGRTGVEHMKDTVAKNYDGTPAVISAGGWMASMYETENTMNVRFSLTAYTVRKFLEAQKALLKAVTDVLKV